MNVSERTDNPILLLFKKIQDNTFEHINIKLLLYRESPLHGIEFQQ